LKKETLDLIKQIENETEFFSNKSVLCDWCEYKSMCPEFGGCPNEKNFQKFEKGNSYALPPSPQQSCGVSNSGDNKGQKDLEGYYGG
jgi:hypothetical protein